MPPKREYKKKLYSRTVNHQRSVAGLRRCYGPECTRYANEDLLSTPGHNQVKQILYSKKFSTADTEFGTRNESVAITIFQNVYNKNVRPAGLHIDREFGFLGASPDGVIEDENEIIEIKCFPSLLRTETDIESAARSKIGFPLKYADKNLEMNKKHDYYFQTILELSAKNDSPMYQAMKIKKQKHGKLVQKSRENKKLLAEGMLVKDNNSEPKRKKKEVVRDENYIPHTASDQHTEMGMAVNFNAGASQAELDINADSADAARASKHMMKWDRKRKKMVHVDPDGGRKMIRTESGGRVPASYRSGRYEDWRKRNAADAGSGDEEPAPGANRKKPVSEFRPHWVKHNERVAKKAAEGKGNEFKNKQQIVKERIRKDKVKAKLKFKSKNKRKKK